MRNPAQLDKEGEYSISGQTEHRDDLIKDLLSEHEDHINAIRANPDSDYQILAHKIRVSEATIKRHIQKLKRAGILLRKGSRKTGHWRVANHETGFWILDVGF